MWQRRPWFIEALLVVLPGLGLSVALLISGTKSVSGFEKILLGALVTVAFGLYRVGNYVETIKDQAEDDRQRRDDQRDLNRILAEIEKKTNQLDSQSFFHSYFDDQLNHIRDRVNTAVEGGPVSITLDITSSKLLLKIPLSSGKKQLRYVHFFADNDDLRSAVWRDLFLDVERESQLSVQRLFVYDDRHPFGLSDPRSRALVRYHSANGPRFACHLISEHDFEHEMREQLSDVDVGPIRDFALYGSEILTMWEVKNGHRNAFAATRRKLINTFEQFFDRAMLSAESAKIKEWRKTISTDKMACQDLLDQLAEESPLTLTSPEQVYTAAKNIVTTTTNTLRATHIRFGNQDGGDTEPRLDYEGTLTEQLKKTHGLEYRRMVFFDGPTTPGSVEWKILRKELEDLIGCGTGRPGEVRVNMCSANPVAIDVLIGDGKSALLSFPTSSRRSALRLGFVIQDERGVERLGQWYDEFPNARTGSSRELLSTDDLAAIEAAGSVGKWIAGVS